MYMVVTSPVNLCVCERASGRARVQEHERGGEGAAAAAERASERRVSCVDVCVCAEGGAMMLMKLSAEKMLYLSCSSDEGQLLGEAAQQTPGIAGSQQAAREQGGSEGLAAAALALSPARALGSPSSALPARSHLAPPYPLLTKC